MGQQARQYAYYTKERIETGNFIEILTGTHAQNMYVC